MTSHLSVHRDQHIAQWRASGLSRAAYCRDNGIAYHIFRSWTKSSDVTLPDQSPAATGFIEVRRPPSGFAELRPTSQASISLPTGLTLRITVGTDAQWIGRVIAAVTPW